MPERHNHFEAQSGKCRLNPASVFEALALFLKTLHWAAFPRFLNLRSCNLLTRLHPL